jgi:hypothetical protein
MDLEQARRHQQVTERKMRECEIDLAKQDGQIEKLQDNESLRTSDVSTKERRIRLIETQYKNSKLEVSKTGFVLLLEFLEILCFPTYSWKDFVKFT